MNLAIIKWCARDVGLAKSWRGEMWKVTEECFGDHDSWMARVSKKVPVWYRPSIRTPPPKLVRGNPSSFVHESIVDTIALSNMILCYDTMEFPLHYKCANLDTQTTCNDESHYRLLLRSNSCKDSLHSYSYKKPDCIPILDLFRKLQSH